MHVVHETPNPPVEKLTITPKSITYKEGLFTMHVESVHPFNRLRDKFWGEHDEMLVLMSMDKVNNVMMFQAANPSMVELKSKSFTNIGWNILRG